jgi:thiamine biosynthesis lipoprotein
MVQHSETFRAMNTQVDVLIETPSPPLDAFISLRLLFDEQEARFSRFRESSMLSTLNRTGEITDARFARVCRLALEANRFTAGLYNPMVLRALVEAGYSRTFDEVAGGEPRQQAVPDPQECLAVDGDRVTLHGGELDLGGIVKGWTVDMGIELLQDRYPNLFLNAGGDLRCCGSEEGYDGWLVCVVAKPGDPTPWEDEMRGAVATSTTRKRRWTTQTGAPAHHLIDPRTGLPADSPYDQVSVWGDETWRAEVWAKAVLIGGPGALEACVAAGHRVLASTNEGTVVSRGFQGP